MTMLGQGTVTNGNNAQIATGNVFYEYDPVIQMYDVNDGGLQQGAYYSLTLADNTGWQGLMFTGWDGQYANFDNSAAQAF